jgi:heme-degrading monooxygenase HmoA
MIAREWKCLCPRRHREGFLMHLALTGVREAKAKPGFLGHKTLERLCETCPTGISSSVEIALVTYWESWQAVQGFAGPDPERAVLFPGDDRYEIIPDKHVRHYEVLEMEMK